jgi:hypothetical protein
LQALGVWEPLNLGTGTESVVCSALGGLLTAWTVFWAVNRQHLLIIDVGRMRRMRRAYAREGVKVYSTAWLMKRRWPVDRGLGEGQVET